ncbi:MAG: TonB-dependent receptor [Candidatus Andeanibacterium colombiense]|uniref:TonB-dependent receptor n=1 Tax=Candidatus Andeanibacterium colombiense TaxID=3121345 RepID=A0AAJ6BMZ3_9SPHN|nr:MAG: TonB-dependent receptor [Sphingomonadaceae bacterium]
MSATMFTAAALATPALAEDEASTDASSVVTATDDGNAIIVTGTRRATTIMNTPINISAVSTADIEKQRIDDVKDIAAFTPGMTISDTGPGNATIVLRGLNASSNGSSSLAAYLGEVPLNYDFKLIDIARVETLLGPQGTLYGTATMAGAIRYIPNRPNTDEIEGSAHARTYLKSHSGDVGYQVDGTINIPIVKDHIAFRSSTGYYFDPGFIDSPLLVNEPGVSLPQPDGPTSITPEGYAANLHEKKDVNFEKTFTTRNQLLFQFDENLSVNFTYAYQQTKSDGASSNSAGVLGTGKYENGSRFVEPYDIHAHLAAMEINANIADIADLVSTTAYTETKSHSIGDNTDLLIDLDYGYELWPEFVSWNESVSTGKQFNQEIRLVSTHGGPFNWTIGGFYNEKKSKRDYVEYTPGFPLWGNGGTPDNPDYVEYGSFTDSKVTEKAIFGEGTFHVTPAWQVTAGARYFKYTSQIAGAVTLPLYYGTSINARDLEATGGSGGKGGWVWKFNSSYNFTPDLMLYATYSKGYRIGGPNTVGPCPAGTPTNPEDYEGPQLVCALPNEIQYGPDTTKNLEVGVRAQFFDRKFTLNFDVYTIAWSGIQVRSATIYGATGITINGSTARSKGFEASFQLKPVPQLTIQGTYSYNDAYLTDTIPGAVTYRAVPGDYSYNLIKGDGVAGDRLPNSAKNSGSLGATYTTPIKDGDLSFNWTTTYRGSVVSELGWDRYFGVKIPGYVLHRASITYDTDKYSISLFADNIFDKYAIVAVGGDLSRVGVNNGVTSRYYSQSVLNPRTVGIEGRVKF